MVISPVGETARTDDEKRQHINVCELIAAFFKPKSFCANYCDCHIRLEPDNTTAVAYVKHG